MKNRIAAGNSIFDFKSSDYESDEDESDDFSSDNDEIE